MSYETVHFSIRIWRTSRLNFTSVWLDGSGKVGRQSRFGRNLPPAERIQPENLAIACHTLEEHPATETSD